MMRLRELASASLSRSLQRIGVCSNLFFSRFPAQEGRFGFEDRKQFLEENSDSYSTLQNALVRLETELNGLRNKPEEVHVLAGRVAEMRSDLAFLMEAQDRSFVYWYERRGRGLFLQATPIDVSRILSERLFDQVDTIILTSATLAVGGNFDFIKARLGIRHSREQVLEPHFDYQNQAL